MNVFEEESYLEDLKRKKIVSLNNKYNKIVERVLVRDCILPFDNVWMWVYLHVRKKQ